MYNSSINIKKNFNDLAKYHYENFPVSSFLIPFNYRKDIAIVYWFARTADDLADEGNISDQKRLDALNEFENEFNKSLVDKSQNAEFKILSQTIKSKNLNPELFNDLLSAFQQDVIKKRYNTFDEVLDYCKRSANPVGRILLEIFNIKDKTAVINSDKICTALQLTNFYQDTKLDFEKGRIYYSLDEMEKFKVTEKMFALGENNLNIKALVNHNVERAQNLFDEGKDLLKYLSGRFKYEIKWTIAGGEKILDKVRKNNFDVFSSRPKLSKVDFLTLLAKSIF